MTPEAAVIAECIALVRTMFLADINLVDKRTVIAVLERLAGREAT